MNILVTGGAGYIGSSLVPVLLAGGHRVRVFDSLLHGGESMLGFWLHPAFELIHGDIRDRDAVRAAVAGMDGVVHLAAIVGDPACARQPDQAREVNLDASISLVEECHRSNVSRFIFASTCSNYGRMSDPSGYVDETSELRPVSLYAETKVAIERMLLQNKGPFAPTLMRFATIFGVSPRMRFDLTVNEFTMEMITKNHLVVFGEQFWRLYCALARCRKGYPDSPPDSHSSGCRLRFQCGRQRAESAKTATRRNDPTLCTAGRRRVCA